MSDTIKTRLATIRQHLEVAAGLCHAADRIGDLTVPGSDIQAEQLAGHAREQIASALNELYWIQTLGERNDVRGAALDTPVPDDEAEGGAR